MFHLRKFAGAHADWKPFLAHVLGFDGDLVTRHYAKEQELTEKQSTAQLIQQELGGSVQDASKIDGMLLLKNNRKLIKEATAFGCL